MTYSGIKKIAIFVLITFGFMVLSPNYSFSENDEIKNNLDLAKKYFDKGRYEKAKGIIDAIISICKLDKNSYAEILSNAYYIEAKIHSDFNKKEMVKESLKNLYKVNLDFELPEDEDNEFRSDAGIIKKEVLEDITPGIRIKSTSTEQVSLSIDNREPKNAKFIEQNMEYSLNYLNEGTHIFYFMSNQKYIKKEGKVEKGKLLKFNLDFTKDGVITKEKEKKKFSVLLVVGAVVVVGALLYFLTKKKPEKTLTVTVGEGVEGTPVTNSYSYKKGASVSYNYSLKSGYTGLIVKLDNTEVDATGTIKMDQNHTLTATATKTYTLTVEKHEGVNGTPESGTFAYNAGETVNYNYTLQGEYKNLVVTLNGVPVQASGTITMNANQTLTASASPLKKYTLTVTKGIGIDGDPAETKSHNEGEIVPYNYSLQPGYRELLVTLDGNPVANTGAITMDRDHTLVVSAQKGYNLTVTKGDGVNGTPGDGVFPYNQGVTVQYEYTLQKGYTNLIVKLDGMNVQPNGIITMDADHTLTAAAVRQ